MAAPTSEPAPRPPGRDWTATAAETVESLVLGVKAKTTILTTIARAIVYGVVIAAVVTTALVFGVIATIRIADVYLIGWAGRVHGARRVWIPYVAVGLFLTCSGLAVWTRRTKRGSTR